MELQLTASQEPRRIGRHIQEFGRNGDFGNIGVNCWQVQNISLEIMEEAYSLPDAFHADPAG